MEKEKRKTRKKHLTPLIVLLLILLLVFAVLWFLKNRDAGIGEEEEAARTACERFLEAYQKTDAETVTELLAGTSFASGPVEMEGYPEIVGSRLQYTVKTPEAEEDGRCVVPVEITSLDFPALAEDEAFLSQVSGENLLEALEGYMEAGDAPETRYEVSVQMVQEDGAWKVWMDDSFSNALLGGYGDFYAQMTEEMEGEQE